MMAALRSNDDMSPGHTPESTQSANFQPGGGPNSDVLNAKPFFSMNDKDRQQTIVHESARAANYAIEHQDTMGGGYVTLPDGQQVYVYGAANIAKIAASGMFDPEYMLKSFPDASTSALGF